MRARLLYRDRDFDVKGRLPTNEASLTEDLGLDALFAAMGGADQFLTEVARRVVLSRLTDPPAIIYRQHILRDCLQQSDTVRRMYAIAVEAIDGERKIYRTVFRQSPDLTLHRAVQVLELFMESLKRLRLVADRRAGDFQSEGFTAFFEMLARELSDGYFRAVDEHLKLLRFRNGVLISAELGKGNKGTNYTLRRAPEERHSWLRRLAATDRSSYTLRISDRDEAGARALADLRGRGINVIANALAQSTDHILSFFTMLRCELGFYVGCLNLHEKLTVKTEPTCFPNPLRVGDAALCARGLYDVGLTLRLRERVVGNDVDAEHKRLIMITGANQGGKSTFLRAVGIAQLMMQAGMFTPAESFSADVREGLFTHYRRGEDASMSSGKFDEELRRMSEIVDELSSNSMVLFNESFAATNAREGAEIARPIIDALVDRGIKVVFVTHLFDLAHNLYARRSGSALFLRAERRDDGRRTFRLIEGEPLSTSFGPDLYRQIFAVSLTAAAPRPMESRSAGHPSV